MDNRSPAARLADVYEPTVYSRAELIEGGSKGGDITRSVKAGALLRLRRDHYAHPGVDEAVAEAVRVGGRIGCVSLLRQLGVFVQQAEGVHVHLHPHMSRIRRKKGVGTRTVLHWSTPTADGSSRHAAPLRDAIRQSVLCQQPRAAIATLDSLLHLRLVNRAGLAAIFAQLPVRLQALLALVDGSAESGPETYVRLILRTLGLRFETQVLIPGVGRVDFVVEGWLIIECDSKEYHEGWDKQVDDRRRDLVAATGGYTTIRPLAADIMYRTVDVQRQIADVVEAFRARRPRRHPA